MSYDEVEVLVDWQPETRTLRCWLDNGLAVDYRIDASAFAVVLARQVVHARALGRVPRLLHVTSRKATLDVLPATLIEAMNGHHLPGVEDDFEALLAAAWRRRWSQQANEPQPGGS